MKNNNRKTMKTTMKHNNEKKNSRITIIKQLQWHTEWVFGSGPKQPLCSPTKK